MAKSATKFITGKVRGSYVNVFNPRKNDLSGEDEYSMMLLVPKSDPATVKKFEDAIQAAIEKKWGAKPPASYKCTFRDGDVEHEAPPYIGQYFITVKSKERPGIVDKHMNPVIDASEFVSGDYCRVSLNAFAYDMKGSRGVSFALNNVQIIAKGEALGRARAEDEFDEIEDDDTEDFG